MAHDWRGWRCGCRVGLAGTLGALLLAASCVAAQHPSDPEPSDTKPKVKKLHVDRSGKARKGKASYYSRKFKGKTMANGEPLKLSGNEAASKVLPLGTTAKVTNLETGQSAVVVVKDRGPFVDGRIIDVTPGTAEKLDMKKDGVVPVEVKPLKLPPKEESDGKSQ
jgi:rare lipoprotein A